MSKFGELIDVPTPVLLNFFTATDESSQTINPVLVEVASVLGDKAKVIKIDVDKNKELADALRIKTLPTLIIYKDGQMKWRQTGTYDFDSLLNTIQNYF